MAQVNEPEKGQSSPVAAQDRAPSPQVPVLIEADHGPSGRRAKILLWVCMVGGIAIAGVAFAYKLAEFIFTLNSNSVQGFADLPVTVYFFVAAGWLVLLAWSWLTGKFKDIESTKWDMLRQEIEYERRGE